MYKTAFGLIGLGVMGKSISLNIADNGFPVSVYNRTSAGEAHIVTDFLEEHTSFKNIQGFTAVAEFTASIERPRKILLMIKAGAAIDSVIEQLIPFLEEGDIIIDGGNSFYKDTIKRTAYLATKKLDFVGCGISGGEEGARKGPSMMPGGTTEVYTHIAPILEKISAKDKNNKPCCVHIGTDGAGHFVKMVHNGIEYAEMQLLAELYALLSKTHNNEEIAVLFSEWNIRSEASYLLEITIAILRKKEDDQYVIDHILDKAKSKGTGSWSSKIALDLGIPSTMISSAVFARSVSSFKEKRTQLANSIPKTEASKSIEVVSLEKAYQFARIVNHQQGFKLIQEASNNYNWNLNLSEIARIWTNGCIIRSQFMETSIEILKENEDYFLDKKTFETLHVCEKYIVEMLQNGLSNRVALDTFSSAYT
jgi:6-phosphogluconate dehydrogenase